MLNSADVAAVRHVVQRILVPCVFVIGLLGNSVSIYVLTRKRMRCTTNIYLTALAITDIIYLTMALLLSLKHYDYVQRHVEIFWQYYGYLIWLCDACAYISIYIAVCFTIERFIAIRYPLKRQTFCTESLAKKVITGVTLFCLLSTISTAFEHEYRITKKSIDIHGRSCEITQTNATERAAMLQLNYNESVRQRKEQKQQQFDNEEQHLPLQIYMPLPMMRTTTPSTLPHNDFEGSGATFLVADAPDEHTADNNTNNWPRSEIEAITNKMDNLQNNKVSRPNNQVRHKVDEEEAVDKGRDEEKGEERGEVEDGEVENSEGGIDGLDKTKSSPLKPDAILRRLKHEVEYNQTTMTTTSSESSTTTSFPEFSTTFSIYNLLHRPSQIVLPTTDATATTHEWLKFVKSEEGWEDIGKATQRTSTATSKIVQVKGFLLATAGRSRPGNIAKYLASEDHSHLIFDSELLMSAASRLPQNDVEEEEGEEKQSDNKNEREMQERAQLLAESLRADEWQTQMQMQDVVPKNETAFFNITDYCKEVIYYENISSSLGENALYTRLWYFFTLFVFVLIPLCLLVTFNCFLILLVHRSKDLRGEMTNANSIRRSRMSGKGSRKFYSSSVSQENRITVTLIAVVLLFIVCQLPWAIYLIVSEKVDIDMNVQAFIGNIFNFLAAINAAANFFLYCVLSDKYRKTVRELITGYRYRRRNQHQNGRNMSTTASLYTSTQASQALNGSRRYRPSSMSLMVK